MTVTPSILSLAPPPLLRELTRPWAPPRGSSVVVAVSGGGDSVALLHLLAGLAPGRGWNLVVATLDHGLRGAEGAEDRRFVRALALELGLPCVDRTIPVQVPPGSSGESAARTVRHDFFQAVLKETGAGAVALGHALEDQVETVLFRLGRGTGLRGMGGMSRWSPPLWRPLLKVKRAFLRGLLEKAALPWREDATNAAQSHARNRLRAGVLPALEKALGTACLANIARAADLAREDEGFLDQTAREALVTVLVSQSPEEVILDRRALARLPTALSRRILRFSLEGLTKENALYSGHLNSLLELALARNSGTRLALPGAVEAVRQAGTLIVRTRKEE